MITHGLRKGQLSALLERVNAILVERELAPVTKPNLSYHLRNLDKPSTTLTGDIIKLEAKKMAEENASELNEAMNPSSENLGAH